MSNAGIFQGLRAGGWQDYFPRLRCFNGSVTQPIASDPRARLGRFLITTQGMVKCQGQITFQAADTFGVGDVYGISLPYPANRSSGGADLPVGSAFLWQGSAASPQLVVVGQTSLMDPLATGGGSQGQEDSFFQTFLNEIVASGTGAFTSGVGTVTVTHGMSITPNAYDIHINGTNTPSTNPQWISVQNITATTFDVVIRTTATTTPATFSWQARAWPNSTASFAVLMNPLRPWTWAAGHSIGWQLEYEARR